MASEPTRARSDHALLIAFVLSGAAALGYELLWTRLLSLALGSETLGILGVLAGFFVGLAAGSVLFHTRARRSRDPVRLFVRLEIGAAIFALASPWLLRPLIAAIPTALSGVAENSPSQAAVAIAAAGLVLLPGTICMGATLPALVEARRRVMTDADAAGLGRLYAANTLGATAGVAATVFLILPAVGFAMGAAVLSALGLAAAFVAHRWGAAMDVPAEPSPDTDPHVDTSGDPDPDVVNEPRLLHALLFGTGLAGVGLEVAGVQVLSQILENTIYTFAATLCVYLLGTAAGSALYVRFAGRAVAGRPATVIAGLLLAQAVSVVLAAVAIAAAPALLESFAPQGTSASGHILAEFFVAATVFAVPTILMGATFAHIVGLLAPGGVGRAYALNTLGSAAAPFVFGVYALTQVGYTEALYLVAYAYLALFAAFAWFRRFKTIHQVGAVVIVVAATAAGPDSLVLVEPDEDWEVLERHETVMGLVTVSEFKGTNAPQGKTLRRLRVGKQFRMGGALAFGERRMGQIPLLVHGDPKRVLVLGLGTGATASAITHFELDHADAVELVPAVVDALPQFAQINDAFYDQPNVTLHKSDARRFLAASDQTYDVIMADLFHPGRDGAGNLYAREHFEAARGHLAAGGLFAQWLPLHQMTAEHVQVVTQTFLHVFPESHAFLGIYNVQTPTIVLLGSATPITLDAAALTKRLTTTAVYAQLLMADPADLLGAYVTDRDGLKALAGDAPQNTDLRPILAFDAPKVAYESNKTLPQETLSFVLEHKKPIPAELLTGERAGELAARGHGFSEALGHYLRGELARVAVGETGKVPLDAAAAYLQAYEVAPDFVPARGMLYQSAARDPQVGKLVYPRMLEVTPDEPRVWQAYLQHLQRIGDRETFENVMEQAKAKFPPKEPAPEPPPPPQP